MAATQDQTVDESLLRDHHCYEAVDHVPGDQRTTAFKRRARLHQARWRLAMGYPEGTEPTRPISDKPSRPIGSRVDIDFASQHPVNFLSAAAAQAAASRIAHPEARQTLHVDRLHADLLSSMPMCFNLFGPLGADLQLAARAVSTWWPSMPGTVSAVRFEWSPGRQLPGRYLENRSAFDVAFESSCADGTHGVVGIETKYHEHCAAEDRPSDARLNRYRSVHDASHVFRPGALEAMVGTRLQQIWQDHLLALSLQQDSLGRYSWSRFVLVHPALNPSFAHAAAEYRTWLADPASFDVRTIESLINDPVYPAARAAEFRNRYLWDDPTT